MHIHAIFILFVKKPHMFYFLQNGCFFYFLGLSLSKTLNKFLKKFFKLHFHSADLCICV